MNQETKKSEMEILFPDTEVEGYKVRPWTWEQFLAIIPDIMRGIGLVRDRGAEFEDLENSLDDPGKIFRLVSLFGPIVPDIVAKTLRIEKSEIEAWDAYKVMNVAFVILIQNAERLKNSTGLVMAQIKMIIPRHLARQ